MEYNLLFKKTIMQFSIDQNVHWNSITRLFYASREVPNGARSRKKKVRGKAFWCKSRDLQSIPTIHHTPSSSALTSTAFNTTIYQLTLLARYTRVSRSLKTPCPQFALCVPLWYRYPPYPGRLVSGQLEYEYHHKEISRNPFLYLDA